MGSTFGIFSLFRHLLVSLMSDPFSSVWYYVALLAICAARGRAVAVRALASGAVAYTIPVLVRIATNGGATPSVAVALTAALGAWMLLQAAVGLAGAVAYVALVSIVAIQRLSSDAHTFGAVLSGAAIGIGAVIVVRKLIPERRRPETRERSMKAWPSRCYVPQTAIEPVSRSEVAERYRNVLSPLFADTFLPAVGRSLQRMLRTMRIGRSGITVGYAVWDGYAFANMGPHALFVPGVLRRFLKIRSEGLRYFEKEYPGVRAAFWESIGTVEAEARRETTQLRELYLTLLRAEDLAERWMFEQSRSLFYITFGTFYIRLVLALHFPLSWKRLVGELSRGVSTVSDEEGQLLWELGQQLGEETPTWQNLTHKARTVAEALLARFGEKTADHDWVAARWRDDPALILELARTSRSQNSPDRRLAEAKAFRAQAAEAIRKRFFGTPRLAGDLIEFSEVLQRSKEERQDQMMRAWGLVRFLAQRIGVLMAGAGILEHESDIFYCTALELSAVARGAADRALLGALSASATARRYERERLRACLPIPRDEGTALALFASRTKEAETGVLRAEHTLPGRARGIARVINGIEDFQKLHPGDILVAPMTNPAWDVLFGWAAAVIVETGGPLSHAMFKAREYGIPAFVGVRNATRLIKDGSHLELDGDTNRIIIKSGNGRTS
jgi:phosphohistidine swiveling domain-containing protein